MNWFSVEYSYQACICSYTFTRQFKFQTICDLIIRNGQNQGDYQERKRRKTKRHEGETNWRKRIVKWKLKSKKEWGSGSIVFLGSGSGYSKLIGYATYNRFKKITINRWISLSVFSRSIYISLDPIFTQKKWTKKQERCGK